jgi:hypothetical protein
MLASATAPSVGASPGNFQLFYKRGLFIII